MRWSAEYRHSRRHTSDAIVTWLRDLLNEHTVQLEPRRTSRLCIPTNLLSTQGGSKREYDMNVCLGIGGLGRNMTDVKTPYLYPTTHTGMHAHACSLQVAERNMPDGDRDRAGAECTNLAPQRVVPASPVTAGNRHLLLLYRCSKRHDCTMLPHCLHQVYTHVLAPCLLLALNAFRYHFLLPTSRHLHNLVVLRIAYVPCLAQGVDHACFVGGVEKA